MSRWAGSCLAAILLSVIAAGPAGAKAPSFLSFLLGSGGVLEGVLSPGPLNEKHRDIACLSCHRAFRGVDRQTCMTGDCHPASKMDSARPAVVVVHEQSTGKNCIACHPDHQGRQAALTVSFHRKAQPAAQKDCANCHGAEAEEAHPRIAEKRCALCHVSVADWKKIGVDHQKLADTPCVDCHGFQGAEAHPEIKTEECTACHTSTSDWKQVTVDHGKLGSASCADCHAAEGRKAHPAITERKCTLCHTSTSDWSRVSFSHKAVSGQSCANCHAGKKPGDSLHAGLTNADCGACHGTSAWKPARFSHASLPAATRQQCANCHAGKKPGDSLHAGLTTGCATCHTSTTNWRQVNFNHSQFSGQSCTQCHRAPTSGIHPLARGTACTVCHSTRAWRPTTFQHPRIPEMREHMQLGCRSCHPTSLSQAVSCNHCHGAGGFEDD